ncbi:LamB/YcsF family protein [Alkalihalobacterium elongatum]|uniref:LamB/YcsF family protein n=1 Tax=Alkalihalobacterium elongatum TaxID=2675466 RepID=UPI001C1FACAF|nr:5-oxoprolinase subunit PxpA [Alkalihalobacterium elongatum]
MKQTIDLNSDIGESFGAYQIGNDAEVIKYISSANIACGYHAGDHNVMHETIKLALKHDVRIGAHPGLPDLIGFGRRVIQVEPKDVYNFIIYQLGAIEGFAKLYDSSLFHVKPHGALFNMASKDIELARAIAEAVYDFNPQLLLYGLAGGKLVQAGMELGLQVVEEVFADRTYQADGSLTPRTAPNALITDFDEALERVYRMILKGEVEATDGSSISINAQTVCVHGDSKHALDFVKRIKLELENRNIQIKPVVKHSEDSSI